MDSFSITTTTTTENNMKVRIFNNSVFIDDDSDILLSIDKREPDYNLTFDYVDRGYDRTDSSNEDLVKVPNNKIRLFFLNDAPRTYSFTEKNRLAVFKNVTGLETE